MAKFKMIFLFHNGLIDFDLFEAITLVFKTIKPEISKQEMYNSYQRHKMRHNKKNKIEISLNWLWLRVSGLKTRAVSGPIYRANEL